MSITKWLPITVGAVCVASSGAAGQSAQGFSVQGSGLYSDVFSSRYQGIGPGAGFEIQGRYTPSALSFGAGFQWTQHGAESGFAGTDVNIFGGFFEPRYVISVKSNNLAPYLSARFSILKLDATSDEANFHGSSTGLALNGGGGLLVRLSPRFNIDIGATYGYTRFGDQTVHDAGQDPDTEEIFEGGGASNVVARVGLTVGIR